MTDSAPLVGVLALQGDFDAHVRVLRRLGACTRLVRTAADLDALDGLLLPGGESTTMMLGIERERLAEPLRELAAADTPIFATCAGMIILDRDHLGILDIVCKRNAFGRQVRSFEAAIDLPDIKGGPVTAVFIRAPWVAAAGPEVELLASVDGHGVAVRQGAVMAISFHPEISGDDRVHRAWLQPLLAAAA